MWVSDVSGEEHGKEASRRGATRLVGCGEAVRERRPQVEGAARTLTRGNAWDAEEESAEHVEARRNLWFSFSTLHNQRSFCIWRAVVLRLFEAAFQK